MPAEGTRALGKGDDVSLSYKTAKIGRFGKVTSI